MVRRFGILIRLRKSRSRKSREFNTNSDKADDIDYAQVEMSLQLDTLELRRVIADVKFNVKSFCGKIDSQTYRQHYQNLDRQISRNTDVFRTSTSRTDVVGLFSVFNRLMTTHNNFCASENWLNQQPSDFLLKMHVRNIFSNLVVQANAS
jgi:hypothetical protein